MLTATAPLGGGVTLPEPDSGLVGLLDAAPTAHGETPCQAGEPDLWFADTPAELDRAKALCTTCPVRAQCLAGALARHEPWGVWGGQIFERGTIIARKRPRGRPRKDDRQPDTLPTMAVVVNEAPAQDAVPQDAVARDVVAQDAGVNGGNGREAAA